MNKKGGDVIGLRKKISVPRPNGTKDKDEDLLLFREMHKHEKDRVVSLLAPVSDEFEANGNYKLYGMAPTGKKGSAYNILGECGKNDYDWLKTPPATPLFPSLEMENGPELVTQREIPIVQPLSRLAGNLEVENGSIRPTTSSSLKPKAPPRYSTTNGRPSIALLEKKNIKAAPLVNQKMNQSYSDLNLEISKKASSADKPVDSKETNWNLLASNLSTSTVISMDSSTKATKPKSRGVSTLVRSKLPDQIPGLSNETPSNLRTDRSISAYRGRSTARSSQQNPSVSQKRPESVTKTRRQSCSPGTTKGRKQNNDGNSGSEKGTNQQANRTQVLGSRMVDRFLNSRMSSSEDRQSKIKLNVSMNEGSNAKKASVEERQRTTKFNASMNEGSGYGRLMSKSSPDMALRHMEFPRDSESKIKNGIITGRRSVSVSKRTTSGW